jgi:hypothetical protein
VTVPLDGKPRKAMVYIITKTDRAEAELQVLHLH